MVENGESTESMDWSEVRARAEQARDQAHRPYRLIGGGYARPLHPVLAAVPIGCFVAAFVFDLASWWVEGRAFGRPASWLVASGVVAGLVAAVIGAFDLVRLPRGSAARRTGLTHAATMLVVLALFAVSFLMRRADEDQYLDGTPVGAFVVGAVAVAALLAGIWFGGALVYRYGVRVADEEDQLLGYLPPDTVRDSEPR